MCTPALAKVLGQQARSGDNTPRLKDRVTCLVFHPKGAAVAERFIEIEV
jgi:hypothetical protein